jgi:hypothetical protein
MVTGYGPLPEQGKVFLKGIVIAVSVQRKCWYCMELQINGLFHIYALVKLIVLTNTKLTRIPSGESI